MMPACPTMPAEVERVFATAPESIRPKLDQLRALIFETAAETPGVGKLSEELRWGEPAYLTSKSGSGTTIRLGWKPGQPDSFALHVNCKTTLIRDFRQHFSNELSLDGNRSILFRADDALPEKVLAICIAMALTYHRKGAFSA